MTGKFWYPNMFTSAPLMVTLPLKFKSSHPNKNGWLGRCKKTVLFSWAREHVAGKKISMEGMQLFKEKSNTSP